MKRPLWIFVILILPLLYPDHSLARPGSPALLKDINIITSMDDTKIELQFTGAPHDEGITYQRDFLQIEFSNAYIDPPKRWVEVNDETIKNIFVYQFNTGILRMRLFTVKRPEDLMDSVKLLRAGNKVVISYNIKEIKETEGVKSPPVSPVPSIENKGAGAEALPQGMVSVEPRKENIPAAGGFASPDIYGSFFRMILALGIVLSLLFISLFIFKRFLGRKMGIKGQSQEIRVITNAYIGSKKSIALVEVSGEKIVVGITPNHITMLTRLGKYDEFNDILKEQISSNEKVGLQDDLWEKV